MFVVAVATFVDVVATVIAVALIAYDFAFAAGVDVASANVNETFYFDVAFVVVAASL